MSEWATLKVSHGLRNAKFTMQGALFPLLIGALLARGNIMDIYPYGIAFGAALIWRGGRGVPFGLFSILAGTFSLGSSKVLFPLAIFLVLGAILPFFRKRRRGSLYLGLITALLVMAGEVIAHWGFEGAFTAIDMGLEGIITGGLAWVFSHALAHQEAVWLGEFTGEQGISWLILLTGVLSGLQGLDLADISFSVVVLTFFILFVAHRFGAGAAAGVGATLGFLPELDMSVQNLIGAGVYALAGFCTGAFQRLGKLGIGLAYLGIMMIVTVSLQAEAAYSQLISSALGLIVFLVWPGLTQKPEFLKPKQIPEVETAVTKVKTLAEIFEQMAMTNQAGEADSLSGRPEIPELMNVLVERVCKNCPTMGVCWEREFYKTYHYLLELFALAESNEVEIQELPIEWKRHCGRLKEMLLGVQFLLDQEKNREEWRQKLANNKEALAYQYQSVSQVISHLAKELHTRHNWEEVKGANLARRRRNYLDLGVIALSKGDGAICGDNYASLPFSPTQHAFVLSDGMGVGEKAAKMSANALSLLEQLLSTGFDLPRAVQALNSILVLRSPEDGFVTLDMAVMELESDDVHLVKLGASPTYLKHGSQVEVFQSSSLPVGILNQIEIPIIDLKMEMGDILVLVTDGIHDVLKTGQDWLKSFLADVTADKAQDLANAVGEQTRKLCGKELPDDGIVLVIRKNNWQERGKGHAKDG